MTYNPLIISSAETQITLQKGSSIFNIVTGIQLSVSQTQDVQEIFAIGQLPPIGVKRLNQRFTASLSLQSGEYETLLDAINAGATNPADYIASMLDLDQFSIGWSISMSGLLVPRMIVYSLDNCASSTVDYSLDRNTPETNTSLSLQGIGITRDVRNL